MGPPFTNLFASCCTSPSFVFGARFATPCMALGPMCHLMCWLFSCGLCCFAVLADRWQVILGEFPSRCTQCNNLANDGEQQPMLCAGSFKSWAHCHAQQEVPNNAHGRREGVRNDGAGSGVTWCPAHKTITVPHRRCSGCFEVCFCPAGAHRLPPAGPQHAAGMRGQHDLALRQEGPRKLRLTPPTPSAFRGMCHSRLFLSLLSLLLATPAGIAVGNPHRYCCR